MSFSLPELMNAAALMLAACSGSLVAGALAWAALRWAVRRWPALAARRAVWLGAQLAVAVAACAALLPSQARLALLPALTMSASVIPATPAQRHGVPARAIAADQAADQAAVAPGAGPPAVASAEPAHGASLGAPLAPPPWPAVTAASAASGGPPIAGRLLSWLAAICLILYPIGLLHTLARLLRARRLWSGLLAASCPLSADQLAAHGGLTPQQLAALARLRLTVMETEAAISPLLIGMVRRRLLLPTHLRTFTPEQQTMVIEHELNHWRRRDPLYQGLSAALQIIFWFNPALHWLGQRLNWAQELGCDSLVLTGRPQRQRKLYASALLRQWQLQATATPGAGMAFGGDDGATVAGRIKLMQQASPPRLGVWAGCGVAALLATALAGGILLQPALADDGALTGTAGTHAPATASATAASVTAASVTAASVTAASAAAPVLTTVAAIPPSAARAATPAPAAVHHAVSRPWRYPLEQMRVISFYGVQRDVLPTPHRGIDLSAANGTPVHAVADGTVVEAGPLAENGGRYGNAVIIEHGGVRSLYAHLSKVTVRAGDRVQAGQLIAASGATGYATGPHLHFEVLHDGQRMDPRTMLPGLDGLATGRALRLRRQQLGS